MAHNRNGSSRPGGIPRRKFIKMAAVAGLLAGCRPTRQPEAVPTSAPTATAMPTNTPPATPTGAPTATPTVTARRSDVIKMYPDAPSKVVHTHHAGVWDGEDLAPEAIRQMLDGSITELTGLNDATKAWAALFDPGERVAIKVNTIRTSDYWTHAPLVMAVTERLQAVGIPAEQIIIFDRVTRELENAGYSVNPDGPGVRCYGTMEDYTEGWTIMDTSVRLSDILLNCDALINVPLLKQHSLSGISFAMKNHYGTFDRPSRFHSLIERAIPELNDLQPIRDRTRLIIGDALMIVKPGWAWAVTGDSIFMSFDPVAHDMVGLQLYDKVIVSEGGNPVAATNRATLWLENAAKLGLGANDPDHMELVEVTLG